MATSDRKITGLLNLPGEIRNRIYDFCKPGYDNTVGLHHVAYQYLQWDELQRCCVGLTQAWRQLRTEYLPIYLRDYVFEVHYQELPRYLPTFIARRGVQDVDTIGLVCIKTYSRLPDAPFTVDILPVLNLCATASALNAVFLHSWSIEPLNYLFRLDQTHITRDGTSTWTAFMQTGLSSMSFTISWSGKIEIETFVKPGFQDEWVRGHYNDSICIFRKRRDECH